MFIRHNMKLSFLDRNKEINKINKAIKDPNSALIVVYGRRRCGKSTLLQHISKKQDIYYLADQRETTLQIVALANEIERTIPNFSSVHYPSWDALLTNLNDRIKKKLLPDFRRISLPGSKISRTAKHLTTFS